MKTLIAEDDSIIRQLLQRLLKRYGLVHTAANGKEAVGAVGYALATGEQYELICLDIMMPEMDGQEALRQIRVLEEAHGLARRDRAKVLMLTAVADRESVELAAGRGCNGFLVKPTDKGGLLSKLSELGLRRNLQTKLWTLDG